LQIPNLQHFEMEIIMTDLTKKFTSATDEIDISNAEQIVKTIQSAVLQDELADSVNRNKTYPTTGDLAANILPNVSTTKGEYTEEPFILENSKRGILANDNNKD
jgi:hypothetical protein